jgi:hypothetical protein
MSDGTKALSDRMALGAVLFLAVGFGVPLAITAAQFHLVAAAATILCALGIAATAVAMYRRPDTMDRAISRVFGVASLAVVATLVLFVLFSRDPEARQAREALLLTPIVMVSTIWSSVTSTLRGLGLTNALLIVVILLLVQIHQELARRR